MRIPAIGVICGAVLAVGLGGCGTREYVSSSSALRYLSLTTGGERYHYALYVPQRDGRGPVMPLVVVLHGCTMTAGQMAVASEFDALASRDKFVVLYPDVDATDALYGRCWKGIWDPAAEGRGRGDAGAIAEMTHATVSRWRINRTRIYAIGISAGAFEAAILGVDYPDVYAAIGLHSGAAYGGGEVGCLVSGESPAPTDALARAAVAAMGSRARIVPVIVIHGAQDGRIPLRCGLEALRQWLATDHLVAIREHVSGASSTSPSVIHAAVPGGHHYTVVSYSDRRRCVIAQMWTIDGMGHFWSGGSSKLPRYSDPKGPSAAGASWRFFSRWHLSGRSADC
jgi:poly(hydroxyalkanoate) depolymerase family esterase